MFRDDFPIFHHARDLVFLDSASSAQKPKHVIDAMTDFMKTSYANIHRGAYDLSMESSQRYDASKKKIAGALGASESEIVFTYNATYAFNLIARSLVKTGILNKGDRILISKIEHHANIVPWQILAEEYGIVIDWIEIHTDGTLDYADLEKKIHNTKILSITGASNVTGEVLDLEKIQIIFSKLEKKPLFIVDGSQRFPHMQTDLRKYGIDFFVATGHKVMADTGIGFFYAQKKLLQMIIPAFCGGGAINSVTENGYENAGLPFRHEPGTPHIIGAVSLLASLEYIESLGGFDTIESSEKELVKYALGKIETLPKNIRLLGSKNTKNRLGVFSFAFENQHPHDIAESLADAGICVRSGHHCAEPLHNALGVGASLRMSIYIYNTFSDIDRFFEALEKATRQE